MVEVAKWNGGYGKYIRIRHNSSYKTAYAHMKRFARGVTKGSRVEQGQVIGYVGTTGRSTGPHLHYEVLLNGQQVNPRRIKMPTGRSGGRRAGCFPGRPRDHIDKLRLRYQSSTLIAGFDCKGQPQEEHPGLASGC